MHLEVSATDGFPLSANLFRADRPEGAVLVVGAMGVAARFYEPLASWLARAGFTALTFDYRGMGASRRGPLSKLDATISTWAERDVSAALGALAAHARDVPITWLGHSLGGQILPFVPNCGRASKVVTVASGNGYWRYNSPATRRKVPLLWWGAVPLMTPLFGYFPGRKLGMVGDLPKGVVMQWRRWCLDREYVVGVENDARARFDAVNMPIASFSFTDDEMMSERSIASLHGLYRRAPKTMHRFAPGDLDVPGVGHFGFFRRDMERTLWDAHLLPELARAA